MSVINFNSENLKIDWNIFQLAKLNISRFDLYYFREIQLINQKDPLKRFFSNLMSELANRYKKDSFSFEKLLRDTRVISSSRWSLQT